MDDKVIIRRGVSESAVGTSPRAEGLPAHHPHTEVPLLCRACTVTRFSQPGQAFSKVEGGAGAFLTPIQIF